MHLEKGLVEKGGKEDLGGIVSAGNGVTPTSGQGGEMEVGQEGGHSPRSGAQGRKKWRPLV